MDEWRYKPAQDLGLSEAERLRSVKRESGLVGIIGRNLWWWWVRGILRITEHVEVLGRENLPAGPPFVMIANHSSHLDVMLLATALPPRLRNCVFPLAAGDAFFETPAVAVFATRMINALPMWRKNCGRHALDTLRDRLINEPCGYILFPEGTRSRTGQMAPFRHGIGMLVAGTNVPVIPCHISGAFEALPPDAKWPRRSDIKVQIGKPQAFEQTPNERSGWRVISETLEETVRSLQARQQDI
ncbi:MAG TPA: lysophospholipid acyltransferase family protein [Candidatus Dormibacteraeota bacterium]|nr:lysophospholipid acyltransferase family protein [Candidatus Dormibacteraeota bacterium]